MGWLRKEDNPCTSVHAVKLKYPKAIQDYGLD